MDLVTKLDLVANNYAHNKKAYNDGSHNYREEYPAMSADMQACKMTAIKEARMTNFSKNAVDYKTTQTFENYALEKIMKDYTINENIPKKLVPMRVIMYDKIANQCILDVNSTLKFSKLEAKNPLYQKMKRHLQAENAINLEKLEESEIKLEKPLRIYI
jgi:hypothetical protein